MTTALLLAKGEGFHVPPALELFSWKPFFSFELGGIEFRVTFITILMYGIVAALTLLFVTAFATPRLVPRGAQNLMEGAIDLIKQQIAAPVLGHDADRWMPYLTALFLFVLSLNAMSVVPPVQFPLTSRMAIPVFLSVFTYVIFNAVGVARNGPVKYLKANLFPPGVPWPIYIILTPIELFSTFIVRPLTLAVRLFANMVAGHVMLTIVFLASAYFLYRADSVFLKIISPVPFAFSIVLIVFELFVALIQAFIITILTAVYIAGASHAEH